MKDLNIFKKNGNVLKVNCKNLRVYIPNSYFENEIAEYVGNNIEVIGIFYFSIHSSESEEFSKGRIHSLKLPSIITLYSEKISKVKLIFNNEEEIYTVLNFNNGDIFLNNTNIIKTPKNTLNFINLLHYGKLPKNIKYEEIISIYRDNLRLNEVNLKVPSLILESIISELCRDKNDRNLPFRLGKSNEFLYAPIKMLPHLNSSFSSISFEDPNKGLALSIKRTKDNKQQAISPIEQVIKF
jgi:hypothetical protein